MEVDLADPLLPQIVWFDLLKRVSVNEESFAVLTPGQRMLLSTLIVEGEVCNGGFHQLYCNGNGWLVPYAASGYRLIGMDNVAELCERSIRLAELDLPQELPPQLSAAIDSHVSAFVESQKTSQLNQLDGPYYKLYVGAYQRWAAYIRLHPSQFGLTQRCS